MRIVIGAIVGLVAACSSGHSSHPGDDDDDDTTAGAKLSISPAMIDVTGENGAPAHATFTATLTYRDGTTKDVTGTTQFDIDERYGAFDHNSLAIGVAGRTQVFGIYSDAEINATASADVIARVRSVRVVAPLADGTPDRFPDDATVDGAPTLVYPRDDAQPDAPSVVLPRNLGDFELHWRDALGDDAFELRLSTDDGAGGVLSDVRIYVPGGAGWAAFRPAEWKAAVGLAGQVTYRLRGANPAKPGTVSATPAYTIALSEADMDGALYYFATKPESPAADGIYRHDMAIEPGMAANPFVTTAQTGDRCIGCHVMSRDGTRMAMTYQDAGMPAGPATMVDVVSQTIDPQTQRWSYGTFTPDNTQFLSVDGGLLVVRDALTQKVLAQMDSAASWITQPDLSADGTKLVYVRPKLKNTDTTFRGGEIYWRTYDEAHQRFGPEQKLISDTANNYHPSWSPDGAWVAFNRNPDTSASFSSYDDATTQVWVVKADGTHAMALTAANGTGTTTNTAVRWAPSAATLGGSHDPLFWLTFSSKRDFGVRMSNVLVSQPAKRTQLWMTPFFPARAEAGVDPSATAIRLPFQNLLSNNQTPQWTARIPLVLP